MVPEAWAKGEAIVSCRPLALYATTVHGLRPLNAGEPILSQPAVAGGKAFIGTADGALYAFEADDPDPGGWTTWGGGPGTTGRKRIERQGATLERDRCEPNPDLFKQAASPAKPWTRAGTRGDDRPSNASPGAPGFPRTFRDRR